MNRRTFLQRTVPAVLIGVAGCSAVKCRIDGNYDRLTVKSVPEPEPETSITIGYGNLDSPVQKTINDAISDGSIKQCHDFSAEMTGVEKLWTHISTEWSEVGETNFEKIERTFLKKGSEYFGIKIIILDVLEVDSAP
jgi:hypothetical protein